MFQRHHEATPHRSAPRPPLLMLSVVARRGARVCSAPSLRRFCSATEEFKRQRRLLYRAKQRGWLELDVLIGNFAETKLPLMNTAELDQFEEVIELENPDLYKWLSGQQPVPAELSDNEMLKRMIRFVVEEQEPLTSATADFR